MRLTTLSAGRCYSIGALAERGGPWRIVDFPAGFALIEDEPIGPILFDTGYGPGVPAALRRWPGILYGLVTPVRLRPGETAAEQLVARGIAPEEVALVVVSHLHADHIGALADFPRARLAIDVDHARPVLARRGLRAVARAFLPQLLPGDYAERLYPLHFSSPPPWLTEFDRAADLTGDGRLWVVRAPGHAAGELCLVAGTPGRPDGTGLTLLAGDAAWSSAALRAGRLPPLPARLILDDTRAAAATVRLLARWARTHPGARIICSHDRNSDGN
ncbi:MBL fold metallo-hydrolase [Propionibacterium australiense]|uniref:MBL fold metallo-hydrolase n=1 Tax=Propionibacterium australiense TaxID=119981 RepID=A0A8B3FJM1_9ACTN|nr:MBL fold metallo-hydrolase [Propionibacterium australiense]RLP10188.1 MBL fold metallo-hydrolase [Propionibacterium australiense]